MQTKEGRWIVPNHAPLRTALLAEAHDSVVSGHFGKEKTRALLARFWEWPGMRKDVDDYVASCVKCQKTKSPTHKQEGLLCPIVSPSPGHTITLDFVSKFVPALHTKHEQCVVIVDKFSKFVMLRGCSMKISAEGTAQIFLEKAFTLFGAPRVVLSDRGPQFTSKFWQALMRLIGTQVALATSHHPQTDGQSERMIQTLMRLIRTFASSQQNRWEEQLPLFEVALNSVPSKATGLSPHEVILGRNVRVPNAMLSEELVMGDEKDPNTQHPVPKSLQAWLRRSRRVWQIVREAQSKYNMSMKRRCDLRRHE